MITLHYNNTTTDAHDAAIRSKRKIATVDAYDYTAGYPANITF